MSELWEVVTFQVTLRFHLLPTFFLKRSLTEREANTLTWNFLLLRGEPKVSNYVFSCAYSYSVKYLQFFLSTLPRYLQRGGYSYVIQHTSSGTCLTAFKSWLHQRSTCDLGQFYAYVSSSTKRALMVTYPKGWL